MHKDTDSTTETIARRVVFLISQPRAGSTLLQRILACHSHVQSSSEPWLMLHPLHGLRLDGYRAGYDQKLSATAVRGFVESLPEGEHAYFDAVGHAYSRLYLKALNSSGARYFLDKTPRYYTVVPELARVFPDARYIFLVRNPLAVLVSIVRTWTHGVPGALRRHRHDLLDAPQLLAEGIARLGQHAVTVHYERLITEPRPTVEEICRYLDLEFDPQMIEYGRFERPNWTFGDQDTVHDNVRPLPDNKNRWLESLGNAQIWRFANDYFEHLGPDLLATLGYDAAELASHLDSQRPIEKSLLGTCGLASDMEWPRSLLQQAIVQCRTSRLFRPLCWVLPGVRSLIDAAELTLQDLKTH